MLPDVRAVFRPRVAFSCVRFGIAGLLVAVLVGALPGRVSAADISADSGLCDVRLRGAIKEGDADRFIVALNGIGTRDWVVVCLASSGGDYFEALRMIEAMLAAKPSVGTRIEARTRCYSACALMFLAGHYGKDKPQPFRRLDATAVLGFHGPYISPDDAEYDASVAVEAYQAGVQAIGQLLALSQDELFPESLLMLGLQKGPDEFLVVDTVDEAGQWSIDLTGFRKPEALDTRMLFQACANRMEWLAPGFSRENVMPARPIAFRNGRHRATYDGFGDEAVWTCVIDAFERRRGEYLLHIQWSDGSNDSSIRSPDTLERESRRNGRSPLGSGEPLWIVHDRASLLRNIAAPAR